MGDGKNGAEEAVKGTAEGTNAAAERRKENQ